MASKQGVLSRYCIVLLLTIVALNSACADQPDTMKRIGILQFTHRLDQIVLDLKTGLTELGFKEDEQVSYLYRNAEVNQDSLISHIQDMIDAEVDLIIALTTPSAVVARKYTSGLDIPVIFSLVSDPIAAGLVESTASPGSNITGVMDAGSLVAPKRLEMLLEVDPDIRRVLVVHSDTPALLPGIDSLRSAASLLGVELKTIKITTVEEVRAAYNDVQPGTIDAVFIPSDALIIQGDDALALLLKREHIPSIADHGSENAVIGYGPPLSNLGRQTAVMVAKVLKGAKPGALPVELPRQYQLKLSTSIAEDIGYQIPEEAYRLADNIVR